MPPMQNNTRNAPHRRTNGVRGVLQNIHAGSRAGVSADSGARAAVG
jgi:hypothetical protein